MIGVDETFLNLNAIERDGVLTIANIIFLLFNIYLIRLTHQSLEHTKKQGKEQREQSLIRDIFNEDVPRSSFFCEKEGQKYLGLITGIQVNQGYKSRGRNIYDINGDLNSDIYSHGRSGSSGELVTKLACIKYIQSKGYKINFDDIKI